MENNKNAKQNELKKKSAFMHMFWINLIYANPMVSGKITSKKKFTDYKRTIAPYILRSYILGTAVILIVYGIMFYLTNFTIMPSMLDTILGIVILMNLVNNFTLFFNVFYESNDAESYMSLPISPKTVFLSKLSVVGLTSTQLSVMAIPLFTKFFYDMGNDLPLAILMGIINFILFSAFTICLNIGLMLVLAKTSLLTRLRTKIIVILTGIAMAANIVLVIIMQDYMRTSLASLPLGFVGTTNLPISSLLISSGGELIFIGISIAVIAITYFILSKVGIKGLYSNIRQIQQGRFDGREDKAKLKEEKTKARQGSNGTSTAKVRTPLKIMLKHNISLLKNGTLMAQLLIPIVMPVIIIAPQISNFSNPIVRIFLYQHSFSFMMIMGIIIAVLGNAGNSISAMLISLDGSMYEYIKSFPFSRRAYIKVKYMTSMVIQSILPSITILVFGIIIDIDPLAIILGIAVFMVFNASMAMLWTIYDYNHIITNWQSVNQLITRAGRVLPVIITFIGIMALVLLMVLYTLANVEEVVLDGIIVGVMAVLAIFAISRFNALKRKLPD